MSYHILIWINPGELETLEYLLPVIELAQLKPIDPLETTKKFTSPQKKVLPQIFGSFEIELNKILVLNVKALFWIPPKNGFVKFIVWLMPLRL